MKQSDFQQRKDFQFLGKRFYKLYPKIAEQMIQEFRRPVKLLFDFRDISMLTVVYSEFFNIHFPGNLKDMSAMESTNHRIKFTALCLYCYDPESIKGIYPKKLQQGLRFQIAKHMLTNESLVSQYIPKAKVYMQAYPDFEDELMQLLSIVKVRAEDRNSFIANNSTVVIRKDTFREG